MSDFALEVKNLSKSYAGNRVVDNLHLQVPAGKIYGFLGRNGAGKTTTIRMIMGLVKPESGEILVKGRNAASNRRWAARQIGAIIETPGFYSNLSARENLLITAKLFTVPDRNVDEALELVDLKNVGQKKVEEFSLGMKQRLGIANALVHTPQVLILDEPTNGLDPIGIKEMRLFLRQLSQSQQITTIISSHILSEIQQTVDWVGIIDKGRLVQETDIESLAIGTQTHLLLEVDSLEFAGEILNQLQLAYEIEDDHLLVCCGRDMNDELNSRLIWGGIKVFALTPCSPQLEDRFIQSLGLA